MTPQDFAALINRNQYLQELSPEQEDIARRNGFLVVFGQSDDRVEFRGVLYDEDGAYNACTLFLGVYKDLTVKRIHSEQVADVKKYEGDTVKIIAIRVDKNFDGKVEAPLWTFSADYPQDKVAEFKVYEDEEVYGNGLVIKIGDLS